VSSDLIFTGYSTVPIAHIAPAVVAACVAAQASIAPTVPIARLAERASLALL
jgi:hypothetical protein